MNKIIATSAPLEDCSVLSSSVKGGKYSFNATKKLIELKYKYKFKSVEEKETVREFYDRFVVKIKGVI